MILQHFKFFKIDQNPARGKTAAGRWPAGRHLESSETRSETGKL